jgi:hypothetical protein
MHAIAQVDGMPVSKPKSAGDNKTWMNVNGFLTVEDQMWKSEPKGGVWKFESESDVYKYEPESGAQVSHKGRFEPNVIGSKRLMLLCDSGAVGMSSYECSLSWWRNEPVLLQVRRRKLPQLKLEPLESSGRARHGAGSCAQLHSIQALRKPARQRSSKIRHQLVHVHSSMACMWSSRRFPVGATKYF